jgi:hypothetical protein
MVFAADDCAVGIAPFGALFDASRTGLLARLVHGESGLPRAELDRKNPSGRRAADATAYTQTTCSTGLRATRSERSR